MSKLIYVILLTFSASMASSQSSIYYWEIYDAELSATEMVISANNSAIYNDKNKTNDKLKAQFTLEGKRYTELQAIKGMKENLLKWTKTVSDVFVGIKKVDEIYSNCSEIVDNYTRCRNLIQLGLNEQTLSYESFIRITNHIESLNDEFQEVRSLVRHLVVEDLGQILTEREEKELNMDEGNRLLILYRINDSLFEINKSLLKMRYTLTSINRLTYTTTFDYEDFIIHTIGNGYE